jgi:hypothetical protein
MPVLRTYALLPSSRSQLASDRDPLRGHLSLFSISMGSSVKFGFAVFAVAAIVYVVYGADVLANGR